MMASIFPFRVNPVMSGALQQSRAHFANAAGFSFFVNVLSLAPTLYMLQIYGRVMPTGGMATLAYLTILLLLSLAVLSYLDGIRQKLLMRSGLRLDKIMAGRVLEHLYDTGAARGSRGNSGLLREFDIFKQTLSGAGMIAVFDLPWIIIFLGLCFYLHPVLGALSLCGSILLGLITWLSERASFASIMRYAEDIQQTYDRQDAAAQKADVVRALGMGPNLTLAQLAERHSALEDQARANASALSYTTVSKFLRQFLQAVALGVGAWLAIRKEISPGAVFAASLLMSRTLAPMEQIVTHWRSLIRGYVAFRAVDKAIDAQVKTHLPTKLPRPKAMLHVDGLCVQQSNSRPGAEKTYILQNVGFSIQPGKLIGVAGISGAGKSTLLRTVAGCDVYDAGTIRIDGAERRDWDTYELSRHIGYMPQEPVLFFGSIRDNICRFDSVRDHADIAVVDNEVVKAARAAGVHDVILSLPRGYDTMLGLNGQGLSGGQAQRVCLARALYGHPIILVLDEPNAFQDAQGDLALMSTIRAFCAAGGSVVVATHRTKLLEQTDQLLVLQGGRVQFFGPPREWADLMRKRQSARPVNPAKGGV